MTFDWRISWLVAGFVSMRGCVVAAVWPAIKVFTAALIMPITLFLSAATMPSGGSSVAAARGRVGPSSLATVRRCWVGVSTNTHRRYRIQFVGLFRGAGTLASAVI